MQPKCFEQFASQTWSENLMYYMGETFYIEAHPKFFMIFFLYTL